MDQGETNSVFSPVQSYADLGGSNAKLLSHELTTVDGLEPGLNKLYSFKFSASNIIGDSPFSTILRIALGS